MKLTPAQKQYLDIKKNYKDAILFFRMGDFYEVFYDDAKICAKVLDIALTTRDKNSPNPIPMAGIPYHAVEKYLPKLLEAGYKVAIAEQVGDVVPGKVVERKVTQVITPGTYVKEQKSENNILAIYEENGYFYIAWGDISLGIFYVQDFSNLDELKDSIFKIFPKETILPLDINKKRELEDYIGKFINPFIVHQIVPFDWQEKIKQYLPGKTDSYGKALDNEPKKKVFALLLDYLESLNIPINILKVKYKQKDKYIYFDSLTIKNLEIFQSSYDQNKTHSLFHVIDKTITSMGSRLLKNWLLNPLSDKSQINNRLNAFEYFQEKNLNISQNLKQIYDIERLAYLIQFKQNSPFHWLKLKISLNSIYEISKLDNKYIKLTSELEELRQLLNKGLNDSDFTVEKDYIKSGFSSKIDELRKLAYHSDKLIIDYQLYLTNLLKIPIKTKYVNNYGYLLEVSKKDSKVFEERASKLLTSENENKLSFVRKQTLKTAERYISPYLKELEEGALNALYQLQEEERRILEQWKEKLQKLTYQIEELAEQVAKVDIFVNLGKFFKENNYTKPIIEDEKTIEILNGRHPVIEKFLDLDETFIENDLLMKENEDIVHIITGPNMGGKSTYLRQNALILLMAHAGLYVPAKKCKTHILSGIFARVGSGDVLVKKQSTFMTEMIEVANILNNADKDSFLIFDELGRGTSTYDGLAIGQAVIEYIVKKLKAKTLFATHYHELIDLEKTYPGKVKNFSVGVYENNGQIIFLKKILPGGADKSYGIYVAKLAGLPKEIIEQAQKIEKEKLNNKKKIVVNPLFDFHQKEDLNEDLLRYKKIREILDGIDIYNITPIKALEILDKLKKI